MILREIDDKATLYAFVFAYPSYWPMFDKYRSEFEMKFLLGFLFAKQIDFRSRIPFLKVTLKSGKPITGEAATAIADCHNLYTSDKPFALSIEQRTALLSVREIIGWYWGDTRNGSCCQELRKYRSAVYEGIVRLPPTASTMLRLDKEKVVDTRRDASWDMYLEWYPFPPPYGCYSTI